MTFNDRKKEKRIYLLATLNNMKKTHYLMFIKEIRNLTPTRFEELRNVYVSSFPLQSTKQLDMFIDHINRMLLYDKSYHLFAAVEDKTMMEFRHALVFS